MLITLKHYYTQRKAKERLNLCDYFFFVYALYFPFLFCYDLHLFLNGCEEEDILSTASCCTRRSLGAILSIYDMKELPLLPHMKRTAALAQSVRASRTRLYYNLHPVLFVFHAHVQCLLCDIDYV